MSEESTDVSNNNNPVCNTCRRPNLQAIDFYFNDFMRSRRLCRECRDLHKRRRYQTDVLLRLWRALRTTLKRRFPQHTIDYGIWTLKRIRSALDRIRNEEEGIDGELYIRRLGSRVQEINEYTIQVLTIHFCVSPQDETIVVV